MAAIDRAASLAAGNSLRPAAFGATAGFDPAKRLGAVFALVAVACGWLAGCAVVSVAGTAATLVVGTVELAADVAVGAARVTGKAIGAAAGAVTPSSDE